MNNLNDGMSWGILPLFFVTHGLDVAGVGILKFVYPAVWRASQLLTGPLSDVLGRKWLIAPGMLVQAAGLGLTAATGTFGWWLAGSILLGIGTAMVYPALIAVVSDAAAPEWRARALGVYQFWRDLGYAVGALLAGIVADILGYGWAISVVAGLTLASGIIVAALMRETRPHCHATLQCGGHSRVVRSSNNHEEPVTDHTHSDPPLRAIPPILEHKHHAAPSVFTAANLMREARRQKRLPAAPVPPVCVLDPDGDLVDHLHATG